jgi:hypothetical protein
MHEREKKRKKPKEIRKWRGKEESRMRKPTNKQTNKQKKNLEDHESVKSVGERQSEEDIGKPRKKRSAEG